MKDWYWLIAWVVAVAALLYVLPRTRGIVNKVVAMLLVSLLGFAALVGLYAVVFMTA
jgi:hypothetical protein